MALSLLPFALPSLAHAGNIPIGAANTALLVGESPVKQPQQQSSWLAEITVDVSPRRMPSLDSARLPTVAPYLVQSSEITTLLVTGAYRDDSGNDWLRLLLPTRPNTSEGWVLADTVVLRQSQVRVIARLSRRTLEIWRGRTRIASFRSGIGRSATPTPTGQFAIWDEWMTAREDRTRYGSRVLALTAHSESLMTFDGGDARIAIHGTADSGRIGRRSSFGCLIVSEAALRVLWTAVGPGTSVTIMA